MLVVLAMSVDGPQATLGLRIDDWAAIGYLAVMATAVAFLCWCTCVAAIGSPRTGLLTGVAPAAAALAGAATIGQLPALPVWLGIGVVCVGPAIGLGSRHRPSPSDAETPRTTTPKRHHPSRAAIVTDE
jgi:drug/metabolite transporter (DMT)-like permease